MTNNNWRTVVCILLFVPIAIEMILFIVTCIAEIDLIYMQIWGVCIPVFILTARLISRYKIKP